MHFCFLWWLSSIQRNMALILGMGPGLFLLAIFWILGLAIFLMTVRAVGHARHIGTGSIIGCTLLSVILFFIPREPETPVQVDVLQYNNMDLYRSLLVVFCGLSVIFGFFFYFATQLMEPIYTMPYSKISKLRSWKILNLILWKPEISTPVFHP